MIRGTLPRSRDRCPDPRERCPDPEEDGDMRLLLVRHGQTSSNLGRLLDTDHPGADLTPLGRAQAAALVGSLGPQPIDAVYASTLVRTQQTAAPLGAWLGLQVMVRE